MPRRRLVLSFAVVALGLVTVLPSWQPHHGIVATFSIVAYDPVAKEWGVGVASKYLAVGGVLTACAKLAVASSPAEEPEEAGELAALATE